MAWAARPEESKTGRPQHRLAASEPANGCPKAIKAHACRVPAAQVATTVKPTDIAQTAAQMQARSLR